MKAMARTVSLFSQLPARRAANAFGRSETGKVAGEDGD
jgi:hypothetical protein